MLTVRIKHILGYQIVIDGSDDLIEELNQWVWVDKEGEIPFDKNNHLIDAMFYGFKVLSINLQPT